MNDRRDHVSFTPPEITDAEIDAVARTIRSGCLMSGHEMVPPNRSRRPRWRISRGGSHQLRDGGLHLDLGACGVCPGDEVIVPTWSSKAQEYLWVESRGGPAEPECSHTGC